MHPREAAAHWHADAEAWTTQARAGFGRCRDPVDTPGLPARSPDMAGLNMAGLREPRP